MRSRSLRGFACILALFVLASPSWAASKKADDKKAADKKKLEQARMTLPRRPVRSAAFSLRLLAGYLALDTEQFKKMVDMDEDYRKQSVKREASLQVAQLEFLDLFHPSQPELEKLDAKFKEISVLQSDLRYNEIRKLRDSRKILTDEQFEKYRKAVMSKFLGSTP